MPTARDDGHEGFGFAQDRLDDAYVARTVFVRK